MPEEKPRLMYERTSPDRAWPRRWTIVDSVILYPGQKLDDAFFVDNRRFKDGGPKTARDTNMTMAGHIGHPFTFDAFRLELHFEHFEKPSDVQAVLRNAILVLDPGREDPITLPAAALEPLVLFPNSRRPDRADPMPEDPGAHDNWDVGDAMAELGRTLWQSTLKEMRLLKECGIWRHYAQLVHLAKEGREIGRRYGPTELIACKISGDVGELSGPVRLQGALSGVLRRGLVPPLRDRP